MVRDPGALTILISKSFSRAGVVQILTTSTSKSPPKLSVFNNFDFQIVLVRRRGANFADFNFPKVVRGSQFLTILTSKSFSRAGVVQILTTSTSKSLRGSQFLTILTSKSLSRAGVVQILPTSTSKSAPTLSVFNDFDFQIVVAHRRGANFADFNFQKSSEALSFKQFWLPNRSHAQAWFPKVLRRCQFLTILTSKSLSRTGLVQILPTSTSKSAPAPSVFNDFDFQIALARRRGANFATSWAADPPHPPVLRSWLSQPAKPQNYGKTQHFAQFLPAKSSCLTSLLYHICAITSLGFRIFSSNSQYSRKLDS